jgi:hypothetical protein
MLCMAQAADMTMGRANFRAAKDRQPSFLPRKTIHRYNLHEIKLKHNVEIGQNMESKYELFSFLPLRGDLLRLRLRPILFFS